MVEVSPGLTVYRLDGVWLWRHDTTRTIKPALTQEDVVRELQFQVQRMHLKTGYLVEALHGLKASSD